MSDDIYSLLFVNSNSELILVYCSFKVICLQDVHTLKQGDVVYVSSVKSTKAGYLVYVINQENFYYHYFTLYNQDK